MARLPTHTESLLVRAALGETLDAGEAASLAEALADHDAARFLAEARATARLIGRAGVPAGRLPPAERPPANA